MQKSKEIEINETNRDTEASAKDGWKKNPVSLSEIFDQTTLSDPSAAALT